METPKVVRRGQRRPVVSNEGPQPRRVVSRTAGAGSGEREYAPKVFEGSQRAVDAETAAASIREQVDELEAIAADTPAAGPLVMESTQVLGPGGVKRAAPRPAQPAQRRQQSGAAWMGGPAGEQDEVLATPNSEMVDRDAVAPGDQILRRTQQAGPHQPTGEPCLCAYEWEVDEDGGVTVYEKEGIATGFRGAPRWMTWCVVCGGERDGAFRPDNAIRYGSALPEPDPMPTVQQIADQVLRQMTPAPAAMVEVDENALAARVTEVVTDAVLNQVMDTIAGDRFIDLLAEKMAAKTVAKSSLVGLPK